MSQDAQSWVALLVQVPLVGVFIWYSLKLADIHQKSLCARDEAYLDTLATLTQKIELINNNVLEVKASVGLRNKSQKREQ